MPPDVSRRRFLKVTAGSAALGALAPSSVLGANERIRFGVIGCGGMGTGHVGSLVGRAEADNVRVGAVCDVYQRRVTRAKGISGGEGHTDYRRVLDNPDLDAVLIATPDHWHAKLAIEALEVGKHVYLEKPMTLTVEQAILSLVTRPANDAATALGEYLGGSEQRFARMMTNKARALGMTRTTYRNANGLPNPEQRTTARDQARLGLALRQHFPQYYDYFSTRSFQFGRQTIGNHNRLLGNVRGVDGIKTGYTRASGFNLVTSAQVEGRSIVAVVMGGTSGGSRDAQMRRLVAKYMPAASRRGDGNLIAETKPAPVPAERPSRGRGAHAAAAPRAPSTPDPAPRCVPPASAASPVHSPHTRRWCPHPPPPGSIPPPG